MDNNLKDILMPIAIIGTFGTSIYLFTKVMTDYILKKKMIDKGFVNDDTQAIFKDQETANGKYSSLKWGLIILSAGLALIAIEYVDVRPDSPLPYGLLAVFISAGFLVYYFIVQKKSN
jgi:hypothetical protein